MAASPAPTHREAYWSTVLADFRRSGLTHAEFCRRRRVSVHSFRQWLYRLRIGLPPRRPRASRTSPAAAPAAGPAFLPVLVRPSPGTAGLAAPAHLAAGTAPLELVLDGRHVLRIPAGFDADSLGRLLDVLEARP